MEIESIVARCPEQFFANNKRFKLRILSREADVIGHRFCITTTRVRFSSHQVLSTCQIEGDPGPDWVYFSLRKNTNSALLIGRTGISRGGYAVSILGSEGIAMMGPGYSSFTIGVQRQLLLENPGFFVEHSPFLQKSTSYRINKALFGFLNAKFSELETRFLQRQEIEEQELDGQEFEQQIVELIITLLTCLDSGAEISSKNRHRIVYTSLRHMANNPHRKITTLELAEVSHCSVRTLQYAFRTTLGISPKGYGDRYRLSLFREALLKTDISSSHKQRIHELAREFGFSHAGNLAKLYRQLFGRLPSEACACDAHQEERSDPIMKI